MAPQNPELRTHGQSDLTDIKHNSEKRKFENVRKYENKTYIMMHM
jgi:hypothetical protein